MFYRLTGIDIYLHGRAFGAPRFAYQRTQYAHYVTLGRLQINVCRSH